MTFYDANELIAYPLVGDDDGAIPSDILVDVIVHAPAVLGNQLALRSISVTPLIVSLVLAIDGTDAAYLTLPIDQVTIHQPTALSPIAAGVSGFVAFGRGVTVRQLRVDGAYRFVSDALVSYRFDAHNPTIQIGDLILPGLVDLAAGAGIAITAPTLRVRRDDLSVATATVALISLTDPNALTDPIPQCLRPAEGTPRVHPVTSINGVVPDCAGNIDLTFVNVREVPTDPGVAVTSTTGKLVIADEGHPCE